jgi:hypothetical protein
LFEDPLALFTAVGNTVLLVKGQQQAIAVVVNSIKTKTHFSELLSDFHIYSPAVAFLPFFNLETQVRSAPGLPDRIELSF